MATASWSTRIRHDSDANFREWGSELNAKLAAVGLTQTADTGQIDWTTVVRAGLNADAGYEIWRFNDAAQATAPIFFRLYYGTGSGTSSPRIRLQVGTGSDGAGALTGGNGTIAILVPNAAMATDTARTSYLCYAHGCLWLSWKEEASATGYAFASFAIFRNSTSTGAVDDGSMAVLGHSVAGVNTEVKNLTYRWDSPASGWDSAAWGTTTLFALNDPTGGTDWQDENGDIQLAIISFNVKRARPFIQLCGYNTNDIAEDVTFSATLFGSTAHTYMAKGRNLGQVGYVASSAAGGGIALIWE